MLRSALLTAWANAFFAGHVSLDQVVDATTGADAPHEVAGLSGCGTNRAALRDVLVHWRRSGEPVYLALPVPGDVRGLGGPAAFRAAALEVGEAALGAGVGLTPQVTEYFPSSAPTRVLWQAAELPPGPAPYDSVRDAQYELTTAIRESASALAAADLVPRDAPSGDALRDARRASERLHLPPGMPPPAVSLLAQAERIAAVLELAFADPSGGAIDRFGLAARDSALRPLADAVRRARVAAYSAV